MAGSKEKPRAPDPFFNMDADANELKPKNTPEASENITFKENTDAGESLLVRKIILLEDELKSSKSRCAELEAETVSLTEAVARETERANVERERANAQQELCGRLQNEIFEKNSSLLAATDFNAKCQTAILRKEGAIESLEKQLGSVLERAREDNAKATFLEEALTGRALLGTVYSGRMFLRYPDFFSIDEFYDLLRGQHTNPLEVTRRFLFVKCDCQLCTTTFNTMYEKSLKQSVSATFAISDLRSGLQLAYDRFSRVAHPANKLNMTFNHLHDERVQNSLLALADHQGWN